MADKRKKEYMTDDQGRKLERYEGDDGWVYDEGDK